MPVICTACGATHVSERPERTVQGHRRFRCRDCGRQFNERTGSLFNRVTLSFEWLWRQRGWANDRQNRQRSSQRSVTTTLRPL